MTSSFVAAILLLPFAGFLINGLLGKKIGSERAIGTIGTLAVLLPFAAAVALFFQMLGLPEHDRALHVSFFSWMAVDSFSVDFAYQVDQLSMIFLLIITGVGSLIHIYSVGYMHGDKGFFRFFAYLNLFIFMMLNLVLADNFLVTFLGWEGVGLCSFLLIGFWYEKKFDGVAITWTGDAAKKAFVVNRIGDLGMLIGMFLLFAHFGTLKYDAIAAGLPGAMSGDMITIATLCLFLGACGKSAQIPLGVWLPDAMAGPTPVSALIHAATMVTAGVFLVARNAALFSMSHTTMAVVAGVAVTTALVAATVGLVQNDIKKVLAYSTVSQLGFMFLALGVGAWTAAVFHVMTHAFFKALLFLGSGSVIHSMHEEQDMQKMGGLKKYMPQTYKTYLVGSLAIAGILPFSGFFSKDEILASVFGNANAILWAVGALAAFFTAFYIFRSVFLTFWGDEHYDKDVVHPHESPASMTVPLWILAGLATVGGFLGLPPVVGEHVHALHNWLEPVFAQAHQNMHGHHISHSLEWILMGVSLAIAIVGIAIAYRFYVLKPEAPRKLAATYRPLYRLLWNKWYVDEVYENAIVTPMWRGSKTLLLKGVDNKLIDGFLHGLANATGAVSNVIRKIQTGVAQQYVLVFLVGILVIVGWLVFG